MPDWLKVILLGIVEGVTEFLPISSTGHLIVAAALLDFQSVAENTFEIFIQIGAVIAVVLFYRVELWQKALGARHDASLRRFWLAVAVACVPAGVIGFLFIDVIEAVLFNPTTVGIALIVGGLAFVWVERNGIGSRATTTQVEAITLPQALLIGVAQTIALIPGISRSGASILGGRLAGLDRTAATRFSFYLAIPLLGLATIYKFIANLSQIQSHDLANLLLGALVAGLVAWWSIEWLLRYVSRHSFLVFGYYRILAGILILLLVAAAQI